jgi:hypothetical protein
MSLNRIIQFGNFFRKTLFRGKFDRSMLRFLPRKFVLWLFRDMGIDPNKIQPLIDSFHKSGISSVKRNPKLIVSLASFPPRMREIPLTLYSLFTQSLKPDEIVLWLGEEQFPNREQDLPESVLRFKDFGLTIKFCKDIRSFKKLIPSLIDYPDDIIVTVDDDSYYSSDCLKELYDAYLQNPQIIHTQCGCRIPVTSHGDIPSCNVWGIASTSPSFRNTVVGFGGVLYPPHSLYPDIFREDMFLKICPFHDDLWFWAMAVLNGTKIKQISKFKKRPRTSNIERDLLLIQDGERLCYENREYNDTQIKMVLLHYPQIRKILLSEKE